MRNAFMLAATLWFFSCGSPTPTIVPANEKDPEIAGMARLVEADPNNGALRYALAAALDQKSRPDESVAWLESLLPLGWDFAIDENDFPHHSGPRFARVGEELARREPKVGASVAFVVKEPAMIPEGIAWDASRDVFYLGSLRERRVLQIERSGAVSELLRDEHLQSVVGLRVSDDSSTLWAATNPFEGAAGEPALVAIDLGTRAIVHRFPAAKGSFLNDIAIARDGSLYVTDSNKGAVLRFTADGKMSQLVPEKTFIYPNGIALSADGDAVYVATFTGVSRIDLATGHSDTVAAPKGVVLAGLDGLYVWRDGLIGIQNGAGRARLVRFTLDSPLRVSSQEVLASGEPRFNIPTTAAIAKDGIYFIGTSQLRAMRNDGSLDPEAKLSDVLIFRAGFGRGEVHGGPHAESH